MQKPIIWFPSFDRRCIVSSWIPKVGHAWKAITAVKTTCTASEARYDVQVDKFVAQAAQLALRSRLISERDNQPAHPFSFFGRRVGKVLWTSGNLRLTVSAGVTHKFCKS